MIIKSLHIENFKSFYDKNIPDLSFNENITIFSLKNGSGKSSILDAISYLFTSKMFNGISSGWEPLDSNNNIINVKPKITLKVNLLKKDYTFQLIDGYRYINGIKFKTQKEFNNYLLTKLNIDVEKFLWYSNVHYMMNNLNSKTMRNIFIEQFLKNEKFISHVQDEFKKISSDYDQEYINDILKKSEEFDLINIIQTYSKNLKQKTDREKVLTEVIADIEAYNDELSSDEEKKYNELLQLEELIKSKTQDLNILNKKIFFKNGDEEKIICSYCNNIIIDEKIINEQNKLKEEYCLLNKEFESIKSCFDNELLNSLKVRKQKNADKSLLNSKKEELEAVKKEIERENSLLNLAQLYQKILIKHLDEKLKNNFPFEIKLFHKNKNEQTYTEVFTILDNGVDFKYLNSAAQVFVGLKLILFLEKNSVIKYPLLIDNAENLDNNSLETLKMLINNKQVIVMKVGEDILI